MAISVAQAVMLLQEHQYRPITGNILLIGRQTVNMEINYAMGLTESVLGVVRQPNKVVVDTQTRTAKGSNTSRAIVEKPISDSTFFELFTDATVTTVDVTDYEGADIIHDMTQPLPNDMVGAFDFVVDGSCLDNIADPAAAQRNFGRCLKSTGRLFQVECGSGLNSAYIMFSPEWFLDFFLFNDWADAKIYVCRAGDVQAGFGNLTNPWDVYHWSPLSPDLGSYLVKARWIMGTELIVVIAERGGGSVDRPPIQAQYRPKHLFLDHGPTLHRWAASDRPLIKGMSDTPVHGRQETRAEHYHYCGTI